MKPEYLQQLAELEAEFNTEILRQAERHAFSTTLARRTAVMESLRALGMEASVAIRVDEIWEDMEHGLLPPKLLAILVVNCHAGRLEHRLDVAVGAFHCPDKTECIFELCMLRAEARQELEGRGGDGHVVDRMLGLRAMYQANKIDWSDCD